MSKSKDKNARYIAVFDGLVDLVEYQGKVAFLIKKNDELVVEAEVEIGDAVFVPPPENKIPWKLPRAEEVQKYYEKDSNEKLYGDLLRHHQEVSELPDEGYYDILTAWDFHTYICHEQAQYSPMIYFLAEYEKGKTRTGKGMIYVAYRGVLVESLREAYLIRESNRSKISIFFDVIDLWKKAERAGTEDVINNRFEKGTKTFRVNNPDKGDFEDTDCYEIFGPTIIGTNKPSAVQLESRAIPIHMKETSKVFDNEITEEICQPMRERLVAFRARSMGEKLPSIAKCTKGRLGDILRPLHQIIRFVRSDRERVFFEVVEKLKEYRSTEKSTSLESKMLIAICDLENDIEKGNILAIRKITDRLNEIEQMPEKFRYSPNSIGMKTKTMGFEKVRLSAGHTGIRYDRQLIEKLCVSYGLKKSSDSSESSLESRKDCDNSESSEEFKLSDSLERIRGEVLEILNDVVVIKKINEEEIRCKKDKWFFQELLGELIEFEARYSLQDGLYDIEGEVEVLNESDRQRAG